MGSGALIHRIARGGLAVEPRIWTSIADKVAFGHELLTCSVHDGGHTFFRVRVRFDELS